MARKQTLLAWFHELDRKDREFTADEFALVMAINTREYSRIMLENVIQVRQAVEHIEAILGTFDETAAARDPLYAQLGAKRGGAGPSIGASPELLAAERGRR